MANAIQRSIGHDGVRSFGHELCASAVGRTCYMDELMLSVSEIVAGFIDYYPVGETPYVDRITVRSSATVDAALAAMDWADLLSSYNSFPDTMELHDDIDASIYPPWSSCNGVQANNAAVMDFLTLLRNGNQNTGHAIAAALWIQHRYLFDTFEAFINAPGANDVTYGDRITSLRTRVRPNRYLSGFEARADIIYSTSNARYEISSLEYIGTKVLMPFTGAYGDDDTSGPWWDITAPSSGTANKSTEVWGKIRFAVFGTPWAQWQTDTGFSPP